MTNEKKLTTASVLAFERKLDCADGLFYAGCWDNRKDDSKWVPLRLREKSVRGTISNRLNKKIKDDPAKVDAEVEKPNLQTVDVATLPADADTMRLKFTLKILSGTGHPSACNSADYQQKLIEIVERYETETGFSELADRYAYNLANGRFLWRNRPGAEDIEVTVRQMENGEPKKQWHYHSFNYKLRIFEYDDKVKELGALIKSGLTGENFVLLEIVAHARMGLSQEVFPSQELVLDKGKGTKSKFLYQVSGVAAMHSQKIGNAIRTINNWYPNSDGTAIGPIAVEPYGSVTNLGKAYRTPKEKQDFYSLLDGWVLKDKIPDVEQQHFVMATFVRGGVFGAKSD